MWPACLWFFQMRPFLELMPMAREKKKKRKGKGEGREVRDLADYLEHFHIDAEKGKRKKKKRGKEGEGGWVSKPSCTAPVAIVFRVRGEKEGKREEGRGE